MDRQFCPFCDRAVPLNTWRRHVVSCSKRPTDTDLIEMWWELGNVAKLAGVLHVAERTVRRWFAEIGFDASHPPVLYSPPVRPPLAGQEFAPRYGPKANGCDGCPDHFECRRRMRRDLWPLCCIPSQHEVAWAFIDGRIGFDSDMPEWLPAVVEEMR